MVTDQQVRRLFKLIQTERDFGIAAMKAGMDEKTARKPAVLFSGRSHIRAAGCLLKNRCL